MERGELPSASRALQYDLCPGSYWLEWYVRNVIKPKDIDDDDYDSTEGTFLHNVRMGFIPETELQFHQRWVIDRSKRFTEEVLFNLGLRWKNIEETLHEKRFWIHDTNTLKPVFSGRFDTLYLYNGGTMGIYEEYKMGWKGATFAPLNRQILVNVSAIYQNLRLRRITGILNQPRVFDAPVSYVVYEENTLRKGVKKAVDIHRRCMNPHAPRIPGGSQCKFCLGKRYCPEANALIDNVIQQFQPNENR